MKRLVLTLLASLVASSLLAQVDDDWNRKIKESQESARKEYESFRQQAIKDYGDFRRKANEEYATFMEQAWKLFEPQPAEEIPFGPKPPQPIVYVPETTPQPIQPQQPEEPNVPQPDEHPQSTPIEFDVKPAPVIPVSPQPFEPIPYTPTPSIPEATVTFFGTEMPFHFDKSHSLHLASTSEKNVADLWRQLSDPYYDNIVAECLKNRKDFNLNDWAYVMLSEQVAEKLCGGHSNEAVVLHMYILTQSGFQMRLGRALDRLFVLVGSKETIYHYKYFEIKGVRYYNFDHSTDDMPFHIFDQGFPKEKTLSLVMSQPELAVNPTQPRTIASARFPKLSVKIVTNKNLIEFFNSCPISAQWNYYSTASISSTVKKVLYPVLREVIKGKSQSEAANILINFVQTGFAYATDQQQFGYERPLYPDESFYYPFCDCEDRAILYSCIIRELMGLDVVLLDYPDHIATAVCFTDPVAGDYLEIDNQRYIICDPTYIGAEIGRCMPTYKTVRPKIQKF